MLLKLGLNLLDSNACSNSFSIVNHANYSPVPPSPADCVQAKCS